MRRSSHTRRRTTRCYDNPKHVNSARRYRPLGARLAPSPPCAGSQGMPGISLFKLFFAHAATSADQPSLNESRILFRYMRCAVVSWRLAYRTEGGGDIQQHSSRHGSSAAILFSVVVWRVCGLHTQGALHRTADVAGCALPLTTRQASVSFLRRIERFERLGDPSRLYGRRKRDQPCPAARSR